MAELCAGPCPFAEGKAGQKTAGHSCPTGNTSQEDALDSCICQQLTPKHTRREERPDWVGGGLGCVGQRDPRRAAG